MSPLRVGVIGAGIAGLAAAIALRRAGHHVTLFEASTFKREVGAAITITPNGTRVLDAWGFDHTNAGAVEAKQARMVDHATLVPAMQVDIENTREKFGSVVSFYHRVDLHSALRDLLKDGDACCSGPPVDFKLGQRVVGLEVTSGLVILGDGKQFVMDLVVIANGIKTQFAECITGTPEPLIETPRSMYRALIDMDKIKAEPELYRHWDGQPDGFWAPFSKTKSSMPSFIMTYPCRGGRMLNLAVLHSTRPGQEVKAGEWQCAANVGDLVAVTPGAHPNVHAICRLADEVKAFPILRKKPLVRLTKGKSVIVGDAAHVMLPVHAQGATLSLEEAATLEVIFKGVHDANEVGRRLELYNSVMVPRAHLLHLLSDAPPFVEDSMERAKAALLSKKPLFPASSLNYSAPVQEFFYDYDAFQEASEVLQCTSK